MTSPGYPVSGAYHAYQSPSVSAYRQNRKLIINYLHRKMAPWPYLSTSFIYIFIRSKKNSMIQKINNRKQKATNINTVARAFFPKFLILDSSVFYVAFNVSLLLVHNARTICISFYT